MTLTKLTRYTVGLCGLLMLATSVQAEPKPITNKKELVGCYERINFSPEFSKVVNKVEYWDQPYQWFCFEADGKFSMMMSTHYSKITTKELRKTLNSLPQVFKYDYITKGVIKTEAVPGQPEQTLFWQVTFLDKDITTPDGTFVPKNTTIMGLINPNDDKVVYWRYLTKLK